ncbi:MAG: hypothetical protein EBV86_01020 [Marivivens sp.]|nr:hypothetical protein [Marivivens sp.]
MDYEVTASMMAPLVDDGCDPLNPTVFTGPPGVGKSEIVYAQCEEYARRQGLTPVDTRERKPGPGEFGITPVNFSGMAPEDLQWPVFQDGVYSHRISNQLPFASEEWAQNGATPETYRGVVIVDELGKNPDLMKFPAQWVNERQWGNGQLVPAGLAFIFTTNDSTHGAGAFDMTSDLVNRLRVFRVGRSTADFLNYHSTGGGERLHPLVVSCCKFLGEDFLFTQEKTAPGQPFSSPRSQVKASRILDDEDFDPHGIHKYKLHATVGTKAATELLAAYSAHQNAGDIWSWIDSPDTYKDEIKALSADTTNNGKLQMASIVSMVSKRVQKNPSDFGNAMQFFNIMGNEETTVTFVSICVDLVPEVRTQAAFVRHYADNQNFYF